LAAAGFEWGDAGEGGERCFVANASVMGALRSFRGVRASRWVGVVSFPVR